MRGYYHESISSRHAGYTFKYEQERYLLDGERGQDGREDEYLSTLVGDVTPSVLVR